MSYPRHSTAEHHAPPAGPSCRRRSNGRHPPEIEDEDRTDNNLESRGEVHVEHSDVPSGRLVECRRSDGLGADVHAALHTENFTTDPGWAAVNNTTGGNNYGYQSGTSVAGGATGEAGKTFARTTSDNYYADTASFVSAPPNLAYTIQGSGKFDFTNIGTFTSDVGVGHMSSSATDRSFMGLLVRDNNRLLASIILADGTRRDSSTIFNQPIDSDYTFSYTHNPTGGAGFGRLTLTITLALPTPFTGTLTTDLTMNDRVNIGGTFNAFGMTGFINTSVNAASTGDVFIDDVAYTIPEPAAATGLCVVATLLFGRRGRMRA